MHCRRLAKISMRSQLKRRIWASVMVAWVVWRLASLIRLRLWICRRSDTEFTMNLVSFVSSSKMASRLSIPMLGRRRVARGKLCARISSSRSNCMAASSIRWTRMVPSIQYGSTTRRWKACLLTLVSSAMVVRRLISYVCGSPVHRRSLTSIFSMTAATSKRFAKKQWERRSPRCFIRTTTLKMVKSCVSCSSTSSSVVRCKISSAATLVSMITGVSLMPTT